MNPYNCPAWPRTDLLNPAHCYKPLYAHRFQPKSGVSLVEPTLQVPIFYCWSPDFVGSWLRSIGFGKYDDLFRSKCINGTRLYHMEAEDMFRVGVESMADADQIIAKLHCIECQHKQSMDAVPPGLPYNQYKSFHFGEEPLYIQRLTAQCPDACSK